LPYVHRKPTEPATSPEQSLAGMPTAGGGGGKQLSSSSSSSVQLAYPARIRKKMEIATRYDSQYIPTSNEIREIEFERYKQVFQHTLQRDILFLRRIKKPIDGSEWLVVKYQDRIQDDAGDTKSFSYYEGFENEPDPTIKRNNLREIIDVVFDRERIVYTIPFSKEAVEKVIAPSSNVPSDLAIAYGAEYGPDPWRGNELTIWNLSEFMTKPFDLLERSNREGYNRKDDTGIAEMLRIDKEEADKRQREQQYGLPTTTTTMTDTRNMNIQKTEQALRKAKSQQQQEQHPPH
jgi:hypothetical protein